MEFVTEKIFQYAAETPGKMAVIDGERSISYGELASAVFAVSKKLSALGVGPGSVVVLEAVPTIEFVILCYGIHLSGAVHVPVEYRIPAERLEEIAGRVSADWIITKAAVPGRTNVITHEEILRSAKELDIHWYPGTPVAFPDDGIPGEILFTTGSTGRSKGVVQTRKAVSFYLHSMNTSLDMDAGIVILVISPLNHAGGLHRMHMALHCGGTIILMDGLKNLKLFYELVDRYGVNVLYLPPAAVRMLLLFSSKQLAALDGKLRFVFTASAAFPQADREKMIQLLPSTKLIEAYGGSEVGSVCNCNYNTPDYEPGCMGKPYPGVEVRITEEGLIEIRSPMLLTEYLGDPDLTAKTLVDGWFHTSDRGMLDEKGRLHFIGRADDVINIGGKKVAPVEVEEIVLKMEAVSDCVCSYIEDPRVGTVLKLYVCIKTGYEFLPKEIAAELRRSVEDYKVPSKIEQVKEIPRLFNGKIDRKKAAAGIF